MAATSNKDECELKMDETNVASSNHPPLVFQCSKCNIIIGDSSAWICANEALRSFTVNSVSNKVTVGKKLQMSEDGPDLGSTYFTLKCGQCGLELGRRYISTNREFDDLREYFTLFVDNCNSYQIGSSEQTIDFAIKGDRKYLNLQMKQMQELVLRMNERITAVEQAIKVEDDENQPSNCEEYSQGESFQINSFLEKNVQSEKKRRLSVSTGSETSSSVGDALSSKKRKTRRI